MIASSSLIFTRPSISMSGVDSKSSADDELFGERFRELIQKNPFARVEVDAQGKFHVILPRQVNSRFGIKASAPGAKFQKNLDEYTPVQRDKLKELESKGYEIIKGRRGEPVVLAQKAGGVGELSIADRERNRRKNERVAMEFIAKLTTGYDVHPYLVVSIKNAILKGDHERNAVIELDSMVFVSQIVQYSASVEEVGRFYLPDINLLRERLQVEFDSRSTDSMLEKFAKFPSNRNRIVDIALKRLHTKLVDEVEAELKEIRKKAVDHPADGKSSGSGKKAVGRGGLALAEKITGDLASGKYLDEARGYLREEISGWLSREERRHLQQLLSLREPMAKPALITPAPAAKPEAPHLSLSAEGSPSAKPLPPRTDAKGS